MAERPETKSRSIDWTEGEALYRAGCSDADIAARLGCARETVMRMRSERGWMRAGAAARRVVADLTRRFGEEMARAEDCLAQGQPAEAERRAKALGALAAAAQRVVALDVAEEGTAQDGPDAEDITAELHRRFDRLAAAAAAQCSDCDPDPAGGPEPP
jgi:transposase